MEKLITSLSKEYELIQGKIDKIADFELKVRGWCITLETAIIIGIISQKIKIEHDIIAFTTLTIIIFVFQYLEQEQLETKKILSERALIIERTLDRIIITRNESITKKYYIDKDVFSNLKGVPRISINLRNASRERFKKSISNMFNFKTHVFYYVQYTMITIIIINFYIFK